MTKVPDKELRQLLKRFPALVVSRTKRHLRISHPITRDFVIAPISGSDWRGMQNIERDLQRLSIGEGYLAKFRHAA